MHQRTPFDGIDEALQALTTATNPTDRALLQRAAARLLAQMLHQIERRVRTLGEVAS